MIRTRAYRDGRLVARDFPVEDLSDHLDAGCTVWADLPDPDAADLDRVGDELALHDLAREDARQPRQRSKVDLYDGHLFLAVHHTRFEPGTGRTELEPVFAFVTERALVTVHGPGFEIAQVTARWDASSRNARHGVAFLLHGLLDVVVDSHFTTVEALDDALEELDDLLFDGQPHGRQVQERSFMLRKGLVGVRRAVLPMREVLAALLHGELPPVPREMRPYYSDVQDHVLRAGEWTDSLRDLVGTILETNLTIQGNQLNTIMKKVTSWAAIIAVPTAVTGFYGQNIPYPGNGEPGGFWTSTALIMALSLLLYLVFRRRDWV